MMYSICTNKQKSEFLDNFFNGQEGHFDEETNEVCLKYCQKEINGVIPLYLCDAHWQIAKRKIKPAYALTCSLDLLGYSEDQYFTLPYLVFAAALRTEEQNRHLGK